jgi:hypothetical protein
MLKCYSIKSNLFLKMRQIKYQYEMKCFSGKFLVSVSE